MEEEKFSWTKLFDFSPKGWWKIAGLGIKVAVAIFVIYGAISLVNCIFPKKSGNINKPTTIILPLAKVEKIDQTSTQISIEEKTWELGMGGATITYDNKSGAIVGGWLKKKW